jgi:hypothetical protein
VLVGTVTSALAIGWTLTLLNNTYTTVVPEPHPGVEFRMEDTRSDQRTFTFYGENQTHAGQAYHVLRVNLPTQGVAPGKYLVDPKTNEIAFLVDPGIGGRVKELNGAPVTKLDSPKATIMALVTDGILTQQLPWGLVLIGVFITLAIELMGLQSLPVAVGVYLPISTSSAMFVGGVVRWLAERSLAREGRSAGSESGPGVLFSSGLIAGGAIAGIFVAGVAALLARRAEAAGIPAADYLAHTVGLQQKAGAIAGSDLFAILVFFALGVVLYRVARR